MKAFVSISPPDAILDETASHSVVNALGGDFYLSYMPLWRYDKHATTVVF